MIFKILILNLILLFTIIFHFFIFNTPLVNNWFYKFRNTKNSKTKIWNNIFSQVETSTNSHNKESKPTLMRMMLTCQSSINEYKERYTNIVDNNIRMPIRISLNHDNELSKLLLNVLNEIIQS